MFERPAASLRILRIVDRGVGFGNFRFIVVVKFEFLFILRLRVRLGSWSILDPKYWTPPDSDL